MKSAFRSLQQAHPLPIQSNWSWVNSGAAVSSSAPPVLTLGAGNALTLAIGDLALVWATSANNAILPSNTAPTNSGTATGTWAVLYRSASTASSSPMAIYLFTATSAGTIQPTVAYSANGATGTNFWTFFFIERWQNGRVDTPPVLGSTVINDTTNPWTTTITPNSAQSYLSWMAIDFNAIVPTAPAYVNNPIVQGTPTQIMGTSAQLTWFKGMQASQGAGTPQDCGLTAPSGMKVNVQAVEVKPLAA